MVTAKEDLFGMINVNEQKSVAEECGIKPFRREQEQLQELPYKCVFLGVCMVTAKEVSSAVGTTWCG
jgi:hypothetical protein